MENQIRRQSSINNLKYPFTRHDPMNKHEFYIPAPLLPFCECLRTSHAIDAEHRRILFVAHINSGSDAFEIKISIIKEIYSIKSLFPSPHQTTVAESYSRNGIVKKLYPVPANTNDGSWVEKDCVRTVSWNGNHPTAAGAGNKTPLVLVL